MALTHSYIRIYLSGGPLPTTSDVFNAIAEVRRREILDALMEGEKAVGTIVADLSLSQPQVSKHLRVIWNERLDRIDDYLKELQETESSSDTQSARVGSHRVPERARDPRNARVRRSDRSRLRRPDEARACE